MQTKSSSITITLLYSLIIFVTPLIIDFAKPLFFSDSIISIFLKLEYDEKSLIYSLTISTFLASISFFGPSEKMNNSVSFAK